MSRRKLDFSINEDALFAPLRNRHDDRPIAVSRPELFAPENSVIRHEQSDDQLKHGISQSSKEKMP
jgi:hypothetical protein